MSIALEILEWVDMQGTDMIHRIPEQGSLDIKAGAQLIVRESQSAAGAVGHHLADREQCVRHRTGRQ